MTAFLSSPVGRGMLTGLLAAATVDLAAFRRWKRWEDAARYSWRTASFRWVQGMVVGGLTALGIDGI